MAKLLSYNFYQVLLGYFTSHLVYHHIKVPGGYRVGEAKKGEKNQGMCLRASRQSGNLSLYLVELKQYKDHFLYCWKHLDICTNLINARMWLLFVLSQLFLRRRCCSCSTDVSIMPHWVQEFAYYQGLPCLGMLIKSFHWRLRDPSPLEVVLKARKMNTHWAALPWSTQVGSCRRAAADGAKHWNYIKPNPKLKLHLSYTPPQKMWAWTLTSESTWLPDPPAVTPFLSVLSACWRSSSIAQSTSKLS